MRPSTAYDADRMTAGLHGVAHRHDGSGMVNDPGKRGRFFICINRDGAAAPVDGVCYGSYRRAYWAACDKDIQGALRGLPLNAADRYRRNRA